MHTDALDRWISRALRAELALFKAGIDTRDPREVYTSDEWLIRTLEHKDGRAPTIDELRFARMRIIKGP